VIEAVFFDGDQTLWDFEKVMHYALEATLVELKSARPGPLAQLLQVRDLRDDRDHVARRLEGQEYNLARLRRYGFARTIERLSADGSDRSEADNQRLAEQLTASYFHHRDQEPALFEDTLTGLDALRSDYRLGLLSNGSRLPDTIGLGGYFEAIVFAQDHRVTKPDPEIFTIAREALRVDPSACVLVGDHELNDVVGAKRSGWHAIWIDRAGDGTFQPPDGDDERPDAVVTSLHELPKVLKTL
jgi:putative hydrolase of the HAD superfamily